VRDSRQMRINQLVDIIGRFLVMGWTWVFILDYIIKLNEGRITIGIFILISTIWWSMIPYYDAKRGKSEC